MASTVVTITLNPALDERFTVDRVVPDEKLRGRDVRVDPGGGGVNVARVLDRLRTPVRALWSCAGSTGNQYADLLEREGLEHQAIALDSGETRRSTHVCEAEENRIFRFVMPGPELTEADAERWMKAIRAIDAELVVLSGSLPPGVPDDFYGSIAQAVDAKVVLDTSGKGLVGALGESIFLVKPNREEMAELCGEDLDDRKALEEAARKLIDEGKAQNVVVSLGSDGALAVGPKVAEHIEAPEVEVKSQIGAGDSMVAGMVHRLAAGDGLVEAASWGVAAGAAALLTEGTVLAEEGDVRRVHERMG